jgi:hypothetical protein
VVGHDQAEHGIAEEFQALVRLVDRVLSTVAAVCQRKGKERLVGEPMTQTFAKCV